MYGKQHSNNVRIRRLTHVGPRFNPIFATGSQTPSNHEPTYQHPLPNWLQGRNTFTTNFSLSDATKWQAGLSRPAEGTRALKLVRVPGTTDQGIQQGSRALSEGSARRSTFDHIRQGQDGHDGLPGLVSGAIFLKRSAHTRKDASDMTCLPESLSPEFATQFCQAVVTFMADMSNEQPPTKPKPSPRGMHP
jgi:hypothetical protein